MTGLDFSSMASASKIKSKMAAVVYGQSLKLDMRVVKHLKYIKMHYSII